MTIMTKSELENMMCGAFISTFIWGVLFFAFAPYWTHRIEQETYELVIDNPKTFEAIKDKILAERKLKKILNK